MRTGEQKRALATAVRAARAAGDLMRQNWHATKKVQAASRHDLKLELDVRCQRCIETALAAAFPRLPVLGEEGTRGDLAAPVRWVVDPIDGTVNFAYGIPHACVSIALQAQRAARGRPFRDEADYQTLVGVVYDPFCDELWTALRGGRARLNDRPVHVSRRNKLDEAVISLGFAKRPETRVAMLSVFNSLIPRVRKVRILGAAALGMAYVASGRLDAYIEQGLRLWDIAAAGLILECAGGEFWHRALPGEHTYSVLANNGLLRPRLQRIGDGGR
ncbi:MAG: inositol monophosphatase [Verrucomicrobia bacterium]|nr:inositol monophosphatase [Verrucomicrobiota bacterium]